MFYNTSGSITPEGLYNLSYGQNSVTLIPTPQNIPEPPEGDGIGGLSTIFSLTMSNGEVGTYRVSAANGVLATQPLNEAAKANVNSEDKNASKTLISTGVLTAVQDLSILPDQVQTVFISKECILKLVKN